MWSGNETTARVKSSFEPGLSAGSRDIVVNVQQAMVCISLTFHPGTICFEPQNTVPHGPCMLHAGSSNSQ